MESNVTMNISSQFNNNQNLTSITITEDREIKPFQESRKSFSIEKEEYSDYSFQNFVKQFQESSNNLTSSYNKERESILRELNNKKKIILKEINQFDFNDPLSILDDSYIKDNYNTNLLINEVKSIENIFSERAYDKIIEKRENLEMIKKIIEYYLNYVVEMNFDSISKIKLICSEGIKKIEFNRNKYSIKFKKSK